MACVAHGSSSPLHCEETTDGFYASPDEVLAYLADRAKPGVRDADARARIAACDTNADGRIGFGEVLCCNVTQCNVM